MLNARFYQNAQTKKHTKTIGNVNLVAIHEQIIHNL